jgi:DMSO/TMAO reductase YedYZ molybdopterin-dependent catalytic subunit
MYGASRRSPVRAIKNVFVGADGVFSSGAASWAKLVTAQPKQSSAANFNARKDTFKVIKLPGRVNTRNETSLLCFVKAPGRKRKK